MATKKQVAANQRNSQKSTGPRSASGKTSSALNSRKHGFAGTTFSVVRLDDLKDIDNLRFDALAFYQPVNSQEAYAVERIALAQMALLRISRFESGLLTHCIDRAVGPEASDVVLMNSALAGDGDITVTRQQNRNFALAIGFFMNSDRPRAWELFLRYQTQTERQYRRAIEDFDRLVALRPDNDSPDSPNEPNFVELVPPPEDPALIRQTLDVAQASQPVPDDPGQTPIPELVPSPGKQSETRQSQRHDR